MAFEDPQAPQSENQRPQRQQGVLWKRRDVFKNKWRPRFFVLQADQAVLTYYLLSKTDSRDSTTPTTISTPLRRSNATNNGANGRTIAPATVPSLANPSVHSTVSDLTTENIFVSENPVDYDVVPRGAIYLAGCKVSINDKLSLPQEGLYAFSIVPPNSDETACHLAARTIEARAAWVVTLSTVCSNATGDNTDAAAPEGEMATSESSWKSLSPLDKLFENAPEPLAAKLEHSLESHLELCEDVAPALQWTPIFQDRDGVSAYQRQDLHGRIMMKSTAVVPHHPKQLLNLLLDTGRRQDYETNIAQSERLDVLSPHTFFDYYAFKAVWPTSPRDFAVVIHWQTLRRQLADGKKVEALVLLAFSCPEAESLKLPAAPHVRASLHASFYLFRLIPHPANSDQPVVDKCHMTRILSYDLGGSLPRNLATTVLMQQAGMPGILSKHLKRVEPTPEPRLSTHEDGPLSNEEVIRDVAEIIIQQDKSAMVSGARRRLNFDKKICDEKDAQSIGDISQQPEVPKESQSSILATVVILAWPLLLHRLTVTAFLWITSDAFDFWFLHPAIIFLLSALVAVRTVVVRSLGQGLPNSTAILRSHQGGPITFTMDVDLKGVLRFIGMKKEERKELASNTNQSTAEISVVHIVAIALARAMQNHAETWNYRRVILPLLWVDGFFRYPSSRLDVSLVLASGRSVCLEDFACGNVQTVTGAMVAAEQELLKDTMTAKGTLSRLCSLIDYGHRHGQCLIVLTKTDSEDDNPASNNSETGGVTVSTARLPSDVDVLVTVGGVRLQRSSASVGSPLRAAPPKPILSLSVTINASVRATRKCQAFAEDLAKLIQFPELCDD